jgi:hypothetical protein
MKTKHHLTIISAIVLGFFVLGTSLSFADPEVPKATVVSKEDAAKKYPPPNGKKYPEGDANYTFSHKPGYVRSPYSNTIYDCSKLPTGSFILDDHVNKVFLKP